ncbi:MAG: 16S rRNA (guanine(966)-N(2))-methyltransferase RsmD [Pseudomonadota bacterium]
MRIVGGELRGRKLATPKSDAIRPTTDRVRETLFNILAHNYGSGIEDARVLDLFSGTGALGIEALSRGASYALFVDNGIEGRSLTRQNTMDLNLQGCSKIYRRDATRMGPPEKDKPFNLLFADPPYGRGLGEAAILSCVSAGWLADGALIVLEEKIDHQPKYINRCELLEQRQFADTEIGIWRYSP